MEADIYLHNNPKRTPKSMINHIRTETWPKSYRRQHWGTLGEDMEVGRMAEIKPPSTNMNVIDSREHPELPVMHQNTMIQYDWSKKWQ